MSVPAEYFENLYREKSDPWNFASSLYEAQKYGATLAALPRDSYESALEIGCSIGVFSARLALRCGTLLGLDVSDEALDSARERCRAFPHVSFRRMQVPREFPEGKFDLITLCEVGFYLSVVDLHRLRNKMIHGLNDWGTVILVHWTPPVDGHITTFSQVHQAFRETKFLRHREGFNADTYRLDVFDRNIKQ